MIGTGNDTDIRITLGTSDVEIYLGEEKVYPNTPPAPDYSLMYFTTEGIYDSDNTVIELTNYTSAFEYSKDGIEWHSTGTSGTTFNLGLRPGEKGYWRCTNPNINTTNGIGHFNGTHPFKVYGNIMSLVYGANFEGQTSLSGKNYIFKNMFSNNQNLMDAENLVLPATTLEDSCYSYMFSSCTSLVNAPALPSTTLANYCYSGMFRGCTSLTTAPELPATTLATYCYGAMFQNCTSLVTAPELTATTLATYCYEEMFSYCTSLTTAPELPARTLVDGCYYYMFYGCTSLNYIKCMANDISAIDCTDAWVKGVQIRGTFVKRFGMEDWIQDDYSGIPTGWTIVDDF